MQRDPTLVHAHGAFRGKLLFPYGWGVVFSRITQDEVAGSDFGEVFAPHQVLMRDDLVETMDPGQFQKRLWGLFTVAYPHTLTLPQRDRIRWHLFPELRVTQQGALDFGKDASAAAPALPDLLQVRTFHAWCNDVVDSYQLRVPQAADMNERYRALVGTVERALQTGFVPGGQYTALLVDEAHDFEDAWLRMAVRLVNPASNSLLVLYDDAQSIYQKKRRKFNFASVGIEARGRTSILKMNYRNTAEVLALAVHCAQSLLQGAGESRDEDEIPLVQPASAGRRGTLPVLLQARDAHEEAELIAERIEAARVAGTRLGDMAVLCRAKYLMRPIEQALARRRLPVQSMNAQAFRRFDWRQPSVRLLTMHSAKGLEFPLVFVAGLQALPMRDETLEDAARLLYVAMTRATHELVLAAHGTSPIVARVQASLLDVAHRFAEAER